MILERPAKVGLMKTVLGWIFGAIGLLGLIGIGFGTSAVYAEPESGTLVTGEAIELTVPEVDGGESSSEQSGADAQADGGEQGGGADQDSGDGQGQEGNEAVAQEEIEANDKSCKEALKPIGWLVCPATGAVSKAVDFLYDTIEGLLVVNPVEIKDGEPIYEIWKYARGIANIVFIIFLLVMVYSQLTGLGITNYGLKKVLPKLILMAIVVNLSFIVCSLAVDASNIIGNSLRGVFEAVEKATLPEGLEATTVTDMYRALAGGSSLAIAGGSIAFGLGEIWMLIPVVLGAIVAVVTGLVTIALRQALVVILVMIAPLAIVASVLPNTEDLFRKWKQLLIRMLVFYPMFSLLFGASSLAGWAIILSAKSGLSLLLGTAVQIFPLIFSWQLMKLSGTILGAINMRLNGMAQPMLMANRRWAESHRMFTRARNLALPNTYNPTLRLQQYLSDRQIRRDFATGQYMQTVKNRGLAYHAGSNYRKDGTISKFGEEMYELQGLNTGYQREMDRNKDNFNKGLGLVPGAVRDKAQRARIDKLDLLNMNNADMLRVEKARAEKIEYDNEAGFYNRMNAGINAHMDSINGYRIVGYNEAGSPIYERKSDYKFHFDDNVAGIQERNIAYERYQETAKIMDGDPEAAQYAAASAAHGYDTHTKIISGKFQKYFELNPPTKDDIYRIKELALMDDPAKNADSIIAGLRVINQRGDTDLVKDIWWDVKRGGIKFGTHASQAFASFLIFDVGDGDPSLKREGKHINLETAAIYNGNDRKEMLLDPDEFIRGYYLKRDEDGNLLPDIPENRVPTKKSASTLLSGTSFDKVERTFYDNFNESMMMAYGYDPKNKKGTWDFDGYLTRTKEIRNAMLPQFISACMKYLSGSEALVSAVKFVTGYSTKTVRDESGNIISTELSPVWDKEEYAECRDKIKTFYREQLEKYIGGQTPTQVLGLRSDFFAAMDEHLSDAYDLAPDADLSEKEIEERREFEREKAEIQTKYGDDPIGEAKEKRDNELQRLKRRKSNARFMHILDKNGVLEQIYAMRKSGGVGNTKPYVRDALMLNDREFIYDYISTKEAERKKAKQAKKARKGDVASGDGTHSVEREGVIKARIGKIFDQSGDKPDSEFFELSRKELAETFGGDSLIVRKYVDYKEEHKTADRYAFRECLDALLSDPKNYN